MGLVLGSEDLLSWELTDVEVNELTLENQNKYKTAARLSKNEYSRCWSEGHKLLKELGWIEKSVSQGHRSFISLVKPNIKTNKTKK